MASGDGAEADPEQRPRLLGQVDAAAGDDLHSGYAALPEVDGVVVTDGVGSGAGGAW